MGDMLEEKCPNKNSLDIFLKGEMLAAERGGLEMHLAGCAVCRQRLLAIFAANAAQSENLKAPSTLIEQVKKLPEAEKKSSQSPPGKSQKDLVPWYRQKFLQIAFASSLVLLTVALGTYFWNSQPDFISDDIFRDGSGNSNSIKLLSPKNNADLSGPRINFSWAEIKGARIYTLILSNEKGDIIKEIKTDKLKIEINFSEIELVQNKHYFWQVKTLLVDGSILESETRKFYQEVLKN
jgi:hypothetical protein